MTISHFPLQSYTFTPHWWSRIVEFTIEVSFQSFFFLRKKTLDTHTYRGNENAVDLSISFYSVTRKLCKKFYLSKYTHTKLIKHRSSYNLCYIALTIPKLFPLEKFTLSFKSDFRLAFICWIVTIYMYVCECFYSTLTLKCNFLMKLLCEVKILTSNIKLKHFLHFDTLLLYRIYLWI